jgi:hypothetical protein
LTSGRVGTIGLMAAAEALHRTHAERRQGDRRRGAGALLNEVGRLRSTIANVATVDLERADRLEARMVDLELELARILAVLGLEPLPPTQE